MCYKILFFFIPSIFINKKFSWIQCILYIILCKIFVKKLKIKKFLYLKVFLKKVKKQNFFYYNGCLIIFNKKMPRYLISVFLDDITTILIILFIYIFTHIYNLYYLWSHFFFLYQKIL